MTPKVQARRIIGTPGNDVLAAAADGDHVLGLAGDDTLTSAFNRTTLDGGSGNDSLTSIYYGLGDPQLPAVVTAIQFGGFGADVLRIEAFAGYGEITTVAFGGDGADNIYASAFLRGGGVAQITILGGAGDDTIEATTDELQTEANFSAGVNAIDGGSGNDTILARAASGMEATDPLGRNLLYGRSGNDQIFGFAIIKGNDGGLAENVIHGGTGDDVLSGLTRTGDSVSGSTAVNRIFGGDGDDQLTGQQFGTGVDAVAVARSVTFKSLLDGGNGSDILFATGEIGGDGAPLIAIESATVENTLIGGAGNDELQAFSRAIATEGHASAVNRLSGGCGNDELLATVQNLSATSTGLNILTGGAGDDALFGELGARGFAVDLGSSRLFGGTGNDRLEVSGGSDLNLLDGGRGCDELISGDGNDRLLGGSGADTFVFLLMRGELGTDRLDDFNGAEDRLAFGGISDAGAPGLSDDLDAITTVTDAGAGLAVTVVFDNGTTLVFAGLGTGSVDSLADLVADPADQLLLA